jgi:hypothetical protein
VVLVGDCGINEGLSILDLGETVLFVAKMPLARRPNLMLAAYAICRRSHLPEFLDGSWAQLWPGSVDQLHGVLCRARRGVCFSASAAAGISLVPGRMQVAPQPSDAPRILGQRPEE